MANLEKLFTELNSKLNLFRQYISHLQTVIMLLVDKTKGNRLTL